MIFYFKISWAFSVGHRVAVHKFRQNISQSYLNLKSTDSYLTIWTAQSPISSSLRFVAVVLLRHVAGLRRVADLRCVAVQRRVAELQSMVAMSLISVLHSYIAYTTLRSFPKLRSSIAPRQCRMPTQRSSTTTRSSLTARSCSTQRSQPKTRSSPTLRSNSKREQRTLCKLHSVVLGLATEVVSERLCSNYIAKEEKN